jgi:hypothetical protein
MNMYKTDSKRIISIILFVLFAGIAIFRLINLGNDTPYGISLGQELSTDPPQYTSFTRNKILYGEWEIFHTRYVLFVKNVTSFIAYPILKLLGTGRAQSNFVAALLNLLSIFFCFVTWKKKGYAIAIASTIILGFNYIFLTYGKLTFLEVTTVFLLSLGGYLLLTQKRRKVNALFSGILFSIAAFFSKFLAIIFFPIALILLILEALKPSPKNALREFNPLYLFVSGYMAIMLLWIAIVYFPSRGEVSGYIAEFSTGMYGVPKAIQSATMFLTQFFSYGFDIKLWSNEPVTFIAGFLGAATLGGMFFAPKNKIIENVDRTDLFFLLWFLFVFMALFPFNYRPLRYGFIIIPPLCYLAARWLLILTERPTEWGKRNWPFYIFVFIAGAYISFHLLITPHFEERSIDLILKYIPLGVLCGIGIAILAFMIHRYNIKNMLFYSRFRMFSVSVGILLLLSILVIQVTQIYSNLFKKQETIYLASKDLEKILSPDAVIVGPYSSALTQNNRLRSVIKMFGVPVVESEFFNIVPATHIVMEAGRGATSNEGRAIRDYPNIMKGAPIVATYYLRGYPVNVYLISQNSPNHNAVNYRPSRYEQAAVYFASGKIDSALTLLNSFDSTSNVTIASKILRYKIAISKGELLQARKQLENIVEMDRGNLNIWLMIGDINLKLNPPDFNGAYVAYQKALYLYPDDEFLEHKVESLKKYRD